MLSKSSFKNIKIKLIIGSKQLVIWKDLFPKLRQFNNLSKRSVKICPNLNNYLQVINPEEDERKFNIILFKIILNQFKINNINIFISFINVSNWEGWTSTNSASVTFL